ncbi:endothelin-converting enzyme-like 1 [Rhipicephalus sanguineus]|uniref:endothelin-converting enzyme-like 1 n=1 Tax=Rhipicephalus sanguineus TaxID=34632 RepID=UPI0020C2DC14|nr:endothelin-converting enzyme-like 1 [Rhipicephalus sanguineus]
MGLRGFAINVPRPQQGSDEVSSAALAAEKATIRQSPRRVVAAGSSSPAGSPAHHGLRSKRAKADGARKSLRRRGRKRKHRGNTADAASSEPTPVGPRGALPSVVICLMVVLLSAALVAYIRSALLPSHHERDNLMCRSRECLDHWQLVLTKVNWSVNPCSDFESFVCSKWKPSADGYVYGAALASHAIIAWFNGFHSLITRGVYRFTTVRKARGMFEVCLTNNGANGSSVALLKQFMWDRKIPWPNDPLPSASPLGVLVDLAYSWDIHLWFRLKPLRMQKSHILLFRTSDFVPLWNAYKEENIRVESVQVYWNKFQDIFATDEPRRSDVEIEAVDSVEKGVLAQLQQLLEAESVAPGEFLLTDISNVTTSISTAQWLKELNTNAPVDGGYGLSDLIVTSDVALLETIDRLFLKYDRRSLLLHLSWFFIQVFFPLEDLTTSSEETWLSDIRRRRLCAIKVEDSYGLLVRSLVVVSHFTSESRAAISGYLDLVRQIARYKISALSWFADDSFRRTASLKLQNARTVLWPPEELLTEEGLSAMYTNFSSNETSLVGYWIEAMKATHALRSQSKYVDVLDIPITYMQPLFGYDYVFNKVLISAAALSLPAYSGRGTRAMVYGGLGFSYALQLVKAFDQGGLKVNADGRVGVNSWAPEEWLEALAKRSAECSGSAANRSLFPEVPALELAHAAYEASPGSLSQGGRITKVFTEDQVFFITACFSLCSLPPMLDSLRGECNKAVANFAEFSRAFNCGLRDPMNPETRCSFFA